MLQKEVIEFLRCDSSSFFTAERYEKLRAKAGTLFWPVDVVE